MIVIIILVACSLWETSANEVWDLGCYSQDRSNKEFIYSAGNYKPSDTSVQDCTSACALRTNPFKYAASEGSYCYCSNTTNKITKVADSKCNEVCTGDVCSGPAYIRVFNTNVSIDGLSINTPGVGFLLQDVGFGATIVKGETNASFTFDFGDKSFVLTTCCNTTHKYTQTGVFEVKVSARNSQSGPIRTSGWVSIESSLGIVRIKCPEEIVEAGNLTKVTAYTTQGTHLKARWITNDEGNKNYFNMSDATMVEVGSKATFGNISGSPNSDGAFIKPTSMFNRDGYVMAWEVYAAKTGTIKLQVYRPVCTNSGELFCPLNMTCIPGGVACEPSTTFACPGNGHVCLATGHCLQGCAAQNTSFPGSSTPQVDYKLIQEAIVNISKVGYNIFTLPPHKAIAVQAGDVIGWATNSSAGDLAFETSMDEPQFYYPYSSFSIVVGSTLQKGGGAVKQNINHVIRAHMSRASYTSKELTFNNAGVFNVSVIVKSQQGNSFNDSLQFCTVSVQERIINLEIVRPVRYDKGVSYATGHPFDLIAKIDKGSNVTYSWDIGNKTVTTDTSAKIQIDTPGLRTVTLIAHNNISACAVSTVISMQNPVGLIELVNQSRNNEVTIPANFTLRFTSGTNITVEISFDGVLTDTFFISEAANTIRNVTHVFSTGGTRTMEVKASNNIFPPSNWTKSRTFQVEVKGKIGKTIIDVEPQLTSDGVLEISTGQQYEITVYSTLDIPINYSLSDGISDIQRKSTLKGKVSFLGKFESKDYTGRISVNATANGELIPLSIPVRVRWCGPPAVFKPPSYSKESPLVKTMATSLELKYRSVYTRRKECSYGDLVYNWRIFELVNGVYSPVDNYEPGKGEVLEIQPLKLDPGNYTVNMTLTYTKTGHQYLYETFFNIRRSELFCLINGGNIRGVPYDSGSTIILNGEGSVDPEQPEDSKLSFRWKCKLNNDNNTTNVFSTPFNSEVPAYCNSTTFQDIPTEPFATSSKLPINHFREKASYVFQLRVSKDGREKECQQIITILPEKNPSISIQCKSNCKDKVNPQDRLIFNAVCSNCKNDTSEMSFKWSLHNKNGEPDTALNGEPSATTSGWNKMSIVFRENKLSEKKHYNLNLEVTRRSVTTVTHYYFVTTSRPYGGSCQVLPEKGYNIESKYHINCKGWQTEDPQIVYEFHYINQRQTEAKISSLPPDMIVSTLWYYGPFHQTPSSSLPIGNKHDNYRLPIVVKIYNRYRAYNSYNLSAIVKPLSSKETTAKIEDISNQLKDGSAEFNTKENAQNVLQLVTAASSLINNDKNKNSKKKIELRKLMVEKLSEINSDELPLIAETCNALSLAIEDKNEVTSDTQITATDSLKRSSEALKKKAKVKGYQSSTPVQLEETAQVVFTGISHTFSASEATTKDFLDQVLENLVKKTGPKSRDWSVRIREWEGEDSADAAQSVVSTLYGAINQLSDAIQENKFEGENETLVTTKTFGMQLSKTPWNSIGNNSLPVRGEDGEPIGSFVLPKGGDLLSGGEVGADETIGIQIVRFPENPVRWDKDVSAFMNSSVIGLELRNGEDKEIPVKKTRKDIEIFIPVTGTNVEHHSDAFRSDTLKTFHYRVENSQVRSEPLLVHIKPNRPLTLYLSSSTYPTTATHDLKIQLPCLNDSLPWPYSKVDNYTILILDVKEFGNNLYLGLQAYGLIKGLRPPNNTEQILVSDMVQVNYTIDVRSVGCKFWSEKTQDKWSSDGCRIGNKTSYSSVQCLCNHLTFFGSIVVKPNPIGKPTAAKFVRGYATFVAVCVIFTIYFIALIWARRKDRADLIKVGACPLPDNDPTDQFRYEITLWTSMRRGAGTNSKVSIILDGEDHDSEARTLEDPERKPFQRGSVDTFLLTTPYLLGPLPYIRIWHDNSGGSWFLSRVMVIDLQTDEHYYFICNRWLAVDEDDGQVERLIPLASKEELTEFQHLFVARTRRNLSDNHLWFSVFARPASSRFTRVQRLTCCLCLMMMSMMTSAMWYKDIPAANQNTNNFAGIKFTWQEVFIGVVSSLIIFPVNLIVVQIFRSVRPKPHRITHRKIPMPPKLSLTVANLTSYNKMKDCSDDSKGSNNSLESMQERNNSKMRLSINDVHTDVDRVSFTSSPLLVDRRQSTMWDSSGSTKLQRMVHWFKRHSSLPYYFIYVAWFLAVTFTLGAALVIILYGMDFGNVKSLKWLFSSTVSFIQDVLITQPLKVLATAIFFALVIKKPDKGEFETSSDAAQLAEDEDWLYQTGDQTKAKKRKKTKLLPPDRAKLIAMRQTRMKERKMHSIIREVGFFYLFLCLVMMIAYTHKDYYSFIQTDNFKKMFVQNFNEIKRDLDFWEWSHKHLIPNLFPKMWYNNKAIPDNGFASDHNSQMVGGARLRHIRIKPGLCEVPSSITFITRDCFSQYSSSDEDHAEYTKSWKNVTKYSKPVSRKDVNWRYQNWQKLDGYPVWAELNTYNGGGYVHVLEPGMNNPEKLKSLEKEFWIDRHSRAVVTEFTVYNAQTNLFTIATLVAEFPATGGVIPFVNIQTARLYNYTKDYMFFILACECLFALYIVFFLYQELRKLYKEGSVHFKQFWNIVDIVIVTSAGVGIGLYIYRLLTYTDVLNKSREAPFQFKSFQLAGYWDEMYTFSIAILVTFSTIKLNKLLRFNKRMSLMSSTLKNAAFPLMMFGLIFGILFLAFTLIGTVVFGTAIRGYRKSGSAFTSLLSLMLGKTSFLEMNETNRILGPFFFFSFMFLVSMVLINMFLSIIIDSYHEVKRDLEKQNNEYEIVDFIIERFKMWSGIGKADKPEFKHRHVRWDVVESKVKSLNALTGGGVDHVSKLESRIEKLIERTDLLFTEIFPEKRRRPTKAMRHKLYKGEHRL